MVHLFAQVVICVGRCRLFRYDVCFAGDQFYIRCQDYYVYGFWNHAHVLWTLLRRFGKLKLKSLIINFFSGKRFCARLYWSDGVQNRLFHSWRFAQEGFGSKCLRYLRWSSSAFEQSCGDWRWRWCRLRHWGEDIRTFLQSHFSRVMHPRLDSVG